MNADHCSTMNTLELKVRCEISLFFDMVLNTDLET